MLEMGIEPYQVTSSISAVVDQRLVRRLCEECKRMAADGSFEPVGCDACLGMGFRGRMLMAEMVELDGDLKNALLAKSDLDALEALLRRKGHSTMRTDAQRWSKPALPPGMNWRRCVERREPCRMGFSPCWPCVL